MFKMEKLSDLSILRIAPSTTFHDIPVTIIGFKDRYRTPVNPNTSVESSGDGAVTFTILPNLPSELEVRECFLLVTFKCRKNKSTYSKTDQISCVNAPGILFWEYCKVYIAGKEIMLEHRLTNHAQWIHLMTHHDEISKANNLLQVGFRAGMLLNLGFF